MIPSKMLRILILAVAVPVFLSSCQQGGKRAPAETNQQPEVTMFTPIEGKIRLMTLDPGHFHASLVQKTMYDQVDPLVYVYAPDGPEVKDHLNRISDYNARAEDPTRWEEKVYIGDDYLEKMLEEHPGNVMVVAGNNAKKTEYIYKAVQQGIYVLADKPMAINPDDFELLEEAFSVAAGKGILIYDIMTERFEITPLLQKELSRIPEVFGQLQEGTLEEPAITKESVHHFFKYVSGKPLTRPPWFFDVNQQGEGIVDVSTHLVDLIQWEAFPEVVLDTSDVEILTARRWATDLTPEMFRKATGLDAYPEYLKKDLEEDMLKVYSNGEINYTLKGIHARVSVIWNFEAPEGTGDTHYSVMRGSGCDLVIRQGEAEGYLPKLYVEMNNGSGDPEFENRLKQAVEGTLVQQYPGIALKKLGPDRWLVEIPERYKVGHEAHFGQVTAKFLEYVKSGQLPGWEIPNMIVKYYTTTGGLKKAME